MIQLWRRTSPDGALLQGDYYGTVETDAVGTPIEACPRCKLGRFCKDDRGWFCEICHPPATVPREGWRFLHLALPESVDCYSTLCNNARHERSRTKQPEAA